MDFLSISKLHQHDYCGKTCCNKSFFLHQTMTSNLSELLAASGIGPDLHVDLSGQVDLLDVKFNGQILEPGQTFSKDQVLAL